ncbi:MAG: tetratricopeptide repeat protein [Phycisphaerales bacterium JB039]
MPRKGQVLQSLVGVACGILLGVQSAAAQLAMPDAPPPTPEAVTRLLDAGYLSEAERAAIRVFHGLWTQEDLADPLLAARAALIAGVWDHPALTSRELPVEMRAEAALHRGEAQTAVDLLAETDSVRAMRLRAEALETLGRFEDAIRATDPAVALAAERDLGAPELTDIALALAVRIRLASPAPADGVTYQRMLALLTQARERVDRLYWPALIAEAQLLHSRDNTPEASEALEQALALNPKAAEGVALFGQMAVETFNFDHAEAMASKLESLRSSTGAEDIAPLSLEAELIRARARLRQRDPDGAMELIDAVLASFPRHREALALQSAAVAATFDYDRADALLAELDDLSPGAAIGPLEVGRALSEARQYEVAAEYLEEAARRQPLLPEPWIELGLLEVQAGRDERALTALERAAALDPFNTRAKNSLRLITELLGYEMVHGEHFSVRFREGLDRLLAEEMLPVLERIHQRVAGPTGIDYEPGRKTIIELMPDHAWFAVRITGMPGIHTIAAATGPVIAMESPREGAGSSIGVYDWPRVLQHEYVHTVTLARTDNRIPHWFTEAAAVYLEDGPWDEDRAELLATKLREGGLFDLEEINIAFVRPRLPTDRSQAYAQGAWMYQYMVERWGPQAPLQLMDLYAEGATQGEAMPQALGLTPEEFLSDFRQWARGQARAWGLLLPEGVPPLSELIRAESAAEADVTIERLEELIAEYPDHPDLAEVRARAALEAAGGDATPQIAPLVERWAELKPIDSTPRRVLARYYRKTDTPELAIPHLEYLDAREQYTPALAAELARLYARTGDFEASHAKAERATRIAPFDADYRELAATTALRLKDYATAERHLIALTRIEPDRQIHQQRLDRLRELAGQGG